MPQPSPAEQTAYARGYARGRRTAAGRAEAALFLLEALVRGLIEQGLTLDAVLDTQILGAKALAS